MKDKKIILFSIKKCKFKFDLYDLIIINDRTYIFEDFEDFIKNTLSKLGTISSIKYSWINTGEELEYEHKNNEHISLHYKEDDIIFDIIFTVVFDKSSITNESLLNYNNFTIDIIKPYKKIKIDVDNSGIFFETIRIISGKPVPESIILELPDGKKRSIKKKRSKEKKSIKKKKRSMKKN